MSEIKDGTLNIGISVWFSLTIFICFWLWGRFTKGRTQFQTNLHVIEEGLRKMQADIELREREKSIGCIEDVEDISEFLKKFHEEEQIEQKDDKILEEEANIIECKQDVQENIEDKKNL